MRTDKRQENDLRPVEIIKNFIRFPEGSVLITQGDTKVLCNVTIEEGTPKWLQLSEKQQGWITAEYAMLPRSTHTRSPRENRGPSGRSQEIRRLIGRSLRSAVDLSKLGNRTIMIDCDVIQADGGTRTASITGAFVALKIALNQLISQGEVPGDIFKFFVAAVSVGVVNGNPLLDLNYHEDHQAEVDFNVVMNSLGEFIEIQGTAEGAVFSRSRLDELINLAEHGINELISIQRQVIHGTSGKGNG